MATSHCPGECKDFMERFLSCLKENGNDNSLCREESRAYLQCRMERYVPLLVHTLPPAIISLCVCFSRNLMTREDFRRLGYKQSDDENTR